MNVLIILIFSTLHAANIREISEIGKEIPDFNKSEDYRSPTDFRDEVAGDAITLPEFWSANGACAFVLKSSRPSLQLKKA